MEVVHLVGAEAVERAAARMEAAAEKMKEAAREVDFALSNHQRFLNDWFERLQGSISDLGELLEFDTPIPVRLVSGQEEEDDHTATTLPAPADNEPSDDVEDWEECDGLMVNVDQLLAKPDLLTGGKSYRDVLVAARARLDDPDRWTQEAFARRADNETCKPRDPSACQWCLLGAIACESNQFGIIPPPLLTFLEGMRSYCFKDQFQSVIELNDYLSHASVLGFLDLALQQFPEEQ